MNQQQLSTISALTEFERAGISFEFAGDDEVKVSCPFHDDDTPSCSFNVKKNVFICHAAGCKTKGDIITFLAKLLKTTRRVMWEDLSKRYNLESVKTIDSDVIERWHEAIWKAKPFLGQLHKRGITDRDIRKYRIGYDGSRITIPIPNESGSYVNVRRYLPGAPSSEKMKNRKGHGKIRLFPVEQLKYNTIVICGGELKAIAVASRINKQDIGAVTATAGEGNWESDFNQFFAGKRVYVCYDVDDDGDRGADSVCARLKTTADWIGKTRLPLDKDTYPRGDVNDYFGLEKKRASDFLKLLGETEEWKLVRTFTVLDEDEIISLHLSQASKAEHTGKRIKLKSTISAIDTAPYVIPKRIKVLCERNQDGCFACPVFAETSDENGVTVLELHPESPAILEMVAASKNFQRDAIMQGLKIPTCKTAEFIPVKYFNVEDVRLSPQLEISSRAVDDILQPALCVSHGLETNEHYELYGRMYPHPKTQQSVLLISKAQLTKDALSDYQPTKSIIKNLEIFRPKQWTIESLSKQLKNIYDDLSANVTRIFERQSLHFVIDLTYHSTLLFEFDGKIVKGWVESLIAGDSSQGKSESILQLMQHYELGERVECKNATVAGLLGGLQQIGTRWFVTWGVIPTHDKRLIILEEIKGTSTEVIGKLTDMRSSGIAEIPKIQKRRTHARTRLIMVSNPRSDRPLSSYNFGIEAVKELIGGLEDIRRFDVTLLVSAEQIPAGLLNKLQQFRPKVSHVYTGDLCRNLVLWAWTRTPDQIKFTPEAIDLILSEATRLCMCFTEIIPIVDRGSMRFKLARLAIALACRTFSSKTGEDVCVRRCHVEYISRFLEATYSNGVFGYKDFSDAVSISNTLLSPDILKKRILQTPFPQDFVKQMLYTNDIELRDISDWCGWDKGDSVELLSLLVRKHGLQRDGRAYRKTPKFIVFLKELLNSAEMKVSSRPEHIVEDEF
jgi:hypothetical protein